MHMQLFANDEKLLADELLNMPLYKSFIHQKTGSIHTHTQKTQKTNLNKVNERVTCSRIYQHGGRVEH